MSLTLEGARKVPPIRPSMPNCIVLRCGKGIVSTAKERKIMERIVEQQANIKRTRKRIFTLLTQCIADIRMTVTASGLEMLDVGVGVERHQTTANSYIVDLKLCI